MAPSSRFALSLNPSVAYLDLNFCAGWKKQMTLPSLAYAGIPYQVVDEIPGALAMITACSRSARPRSGSVISSIFARTSLSPSALPPREARRAGALSSLARSFIALRSSSVKPSYVLFFAVVFLADFCVSFIKGFLATSLDRDDIHAREPPRQQASPKLTGPCHLVHRPPIGTGRRQTVPCCRHATDLARRLGRPARRPRLHQMRRGPPRPGS